MSLVAGRKVNAGVGKMNSVLNGLFVKKSAGEGMLTNEERGVLARLEHSLLLRAFIDPTVGYEVREGYVPPRLELELVYISVRGNLPEPSVRFEDLVYFAKDRLGMLSGQY